MKKYHKYILTVFLLIVGLFSCLIANAAVTTNFWFQNSTNSLATNTLGGLATADIHVAHCYIGIGTGTPCGGGGGSGTVTSFSAGNLSPLFTTSVATATTTPALSFALSNAAAHTFFGNFTGSTGAPSFSSPTLASADFANQGTTTTVLHGNASGNPSWAAVTLTTDVTGVLPVANGGTGANTLTNHGVVIGQTTSAVHITTAGTSRQLLVSGGASADPTWTTETYAVPGTSGNVLTSDGTNWTSAVPAAPVSYTGLVEGISFQDSNSSIADQTYTLDLAAPYGYTINTMKIVSGSGTTTAALKINGTNVTSCSAVSVTTSIATCTASGANTVSVNDKVTLVISSSSSLNNLQATVKTTRI